MSQVPLIWPERLSRRLEQLWASGLAQRPSLEPEVIVRTAAQRERAVAKNGAWRDRLDVLCIALAQEARLSALGRTIAHGQLVRIVASRARAEDWRRRLPQIADRPVAAPIVVVGQMRSGTTRAHRLLACDPAFAHTRLFETLEPVPYRAVIDRRPAAALAALAMMRLCNPAIAAIHPTSPRAPEEEFGLHAFSVWGAQFEGQWRVPSFAAALEKTGPEAVRDVYTEFKGLLQLSGHLRGLDPARPWLLKAPQFCQDLDALLTIFPDARVIMLQRSPERVVASGASLAWHQMRIQADNLDRNAIGREWLRKTALREDRLERSLGRGVPHLRLDYDEVSRDWQAAMHRVYAFLGRPLPPVVEARMQAFVDRSTAHRGHQYALEDFGLDAQGVRSALA